MSGIQWVGVEDALPDDPAELRKLTLRYRTALNLIRTHYGQVCEEFEICDHPACSASYGSWALADGALSEYVTTEREERVGELLSYLARVFGLHYSDLMQITASELEHLKTLYYRVNG